MFCNQCGLEVTAESKFCSRCGNQLTQPSPPKDESSVLEISDSEVSSESAQVSAEIPKINDEFPDGFFGKLARGDYGLAKTYWLCGVLVGLIANFVIGIIFQITDAVFFPVVGGLIATIYQIPLLTGIWRAANKYSGPKIWAILAKIACIFGALMLMIFVFGLIAAL